MTTLRTAALALGFTLLGATASFTATAAARGHSGDGRHRGMRLGRALSALDLTDEQAQMVEDLKEDARADRKAQRGGRGRLTIEAIMSGEPVDREALHAQLDDAAASRVAMAHTHLDRVLDIYDTLDEFQKAELAEVMEEQQQRRSEARAGSGGRGGRHGGRGEGAGADDFGGEGERSGGRRGDGERSGGRGR